MNDIHSVQRVAKRQQQEILIKSLTHRHGVATLLLRFCKSKG